MDRNINDFSELTKLEKEDIILKGFISKCFIEKNGIWNSMPEWMKWVLCQDKLDLGVKSNYSVPIPFQM